MTMQREFLTNTSRVWFFLFSLRKNHEQTDFLLYGECVWRFLSAILTGISSFFCMKLEKPHNPRLCNSMKFSEIISKTMVTKTCYRNLLFLVFNLHIYVISFPANITEKKSTRKPWCMH